MSTIALLTVALAGWSFIPPPGQAIVYVGDPAGAMAGKSNCIPCNRLCRDLQRHYKTDKGRYVIGTETKALFRVMRAPPEIKSTPTIVFPNRTIRGYSGNHKTLVQYHPEVRRIRKR